MAVVVCRYYAPSPQHLSQPLVADSLSSFQSRMQHLQTMTIITPVLQTWASPAGLFTSSPTLPGTCKLLRGCPAPG